MRCWEVASGRIDSDFDTWTGGPCSYPAYLVDGGDVMVGGLHGVARRIRSTVPDVRLEEGGWTRYAAARRYAWTLDVSEGRALVVHDVRDGRVVCAVDVGRFGRDP